MNEPKEIWLSGLAIGIADTKDETLITVSIPGGTGVMLVPETARVLFAAGIMLCDRLLAPSPDGDTPAKPEGEGRAA